MSYNKDTYDVLPGNSWSSFRYNGFWLKIPSIYRTVFNSADPSGFYRVRCTAEQTTYTINGF